jgi:hypothetical protein
MSCKAYNGDAQACGSKEMILLKDRIVPASNFAIAIEIRACAQMFIINVPIYKCAETITLSYSTRTAYKTHRLVANVRYFD